MRADMAAPSIACSNAARSTVPRRFLMFGQNHTLKRDGFLQACRAHAGRGGELQDDSALNVSLLRCRIVSPILSAKA